MMEFTLDRDTRWTNVSGHILPRLKLIEPVDEDHRRIEEKLTEIRIEIRYHGQLFYMVQILHEEDIKQYGHLNLWEFILDKMVQMLDERLEVWDATGQHDLAPNIQLGEN